MFYENVSIRCCCYIRSVKKIRPSKTTKMTIELDDTVSFPAYFVRCKTKTEQRKFVATHALHWLSFQKRQGSLGAVMVDIDDTLIDGNECVMHGFQFMKELFDEASVLFPVHIVTARPDDNHDVVMRLLQKRGFCIPPDRLHMLPAHLYGKDYKYVEEFKWNTFLKIGKAHKGLWHGLETNCGTWLIF